MEKICYIVGASEVGNITISPYGEDFVIAADGGLSNLDRLGVKADLIVGDFDSLHFVPISDNVIRYPVEKDDTDMMIAINEGLSRKFSTFVILGGLGGRLDHTLANIQILTYLAENHARGYLVGDNQIITAIKNTRINFNKNFKGIISVFSGGDKAEGVNLSGLKYELHNAELSNKIPLGISNEFIGKDSLVEVKNGTLLIMWKEEYIDFLKNLYQ